MEIGENEAAMYVQGRSTCKTINDTRSLCSLW